MPYFQGFQRSFPKEKDREIDTVKTLSKNKNDNGQIKSLAFGSVADERHTFISVRTSRFVGFAVRQS